MGPPTFKKASKHSCAGYDANGRCERAGEIFDPIWVPAGGTPAEKPPPAIVARPRSCWKRKPRPNRADRG